MKVCFVAWKGPHHAFSFDAGFRTLNDYIFGPVRDVDLEEVDVLLADELEKEFRKKHPDYESEYNHADVITDKIFQHNEICDDQFFNQLL